MLNRGCSIRRLVAGSGDGQGLPVGRRVRVPRPASGRDGPCSTPHPRPARATDPAGGVAAVHRRRRAALVAPAVGRESARVSPTISCGCRTSRALRAGDRRRDSGRVAPFLEARTRAGEQERYFVPDGLAGDCARSTSTAAARSLGEQTVGPHGLPLIGTGDWNDGMSRSGSMGPGESVWLAWFLIDVLKGFAGIVAGRGERDWPIATEASRPFGRGGRGRAWDGAWYVGPIFDDGTPVGSTAASRTASIP